MDALDPSLATNETRGQIKKDGEDSQSSRAKYILEASTPGLYNGEKERKRETEENVAERGDTHTHEQAPHTFKLAYNV